ncbi:hypothetical protein RM844_15275 [Streptomyces sp. DSM 44915]|uniref:Uncharacterized protein n=1 Tax=Streptomyces chisholmiae TaxID=3075540 RepID=A0ABU2JRN3_9ACTN|nr:hypothetical protein [Streptomyces sp. DSM 44915]MDT0267648.1 hypothetical protein [Streptomyces sp. DSM 44915]
MPTPTSLDDLSRALADPRPEVVLTACWQAFDVGLELAHAVAWQDGFDELQALVTTQLCAEGRSLLPLPRDGDPVTPPAASPATANRCAELLDGVRAALTSLTDSPELPAESLRQTAALAQQAAQSLHALPAE